jgi:hypothetical protein
MKSAHKTQSQSFVFSKIAVLVLAISQLVSPAFFTFDELQANQALIIPAPSTFAIWGVIILGTIAFGGYQLFAKDKAGDRFVSINLLASMVFACYSLWLYTAGLSLEWISVAVFATMLFLLIHINQKINEFKLDSTEKLIVQAPFLVYLGWSTIGLFANITAALSIQGYIFNDERSLVSYVAILLAALGTAIWVGLQVRFNWYFVGTIIWAFVGIILGSSSRGSIIAPLICVLAIGIVLGSQWYVRKNSLAS